VGPRVFFLERPDVVASGDDVGGVQGAVADWWALAHVSDAMHGTTGSTFASLAALVRGVEIDHLEFLDGPRYRFGRILERTM
jgi:hypothetical protein